MNLLDRFKRNRQTSVLPEEVKQYYQSESSGGQRRGVAIGLSVVALLVTVAVAAGLFFGGRFAYNKIAGDDDEDKKTETAQNEADDGFGAVDSKSQQPAQNQTATPTPAPSTSTPQTPPAQSNPTTPVLGDEPLPHTGDEGM